MKRVLCAVLCLCMLLGLWGCAPEPGPTEPAQPTSRPTQPTAEATEPAVPGTVAIPQVGEYAEFILMDGVPGQNVCEVLSARSDGTVDYIFTRMDSYDAWKDGIYSLREAGFRYFTVAPDGSAAEQPGDWMDQLDEVLAVNAEKHSSIRWSVQFSAWNGNILIDLRIFDRDGIEDYYSAVYHLYDGVLTQIPFSGTVEVDGNTLRFPVNSFRVCAMEGGLLIHVPGTWITGTGVNTESNYLFTIAYDGTLQSCTELKDADSWFFSSAGGNTVHFVTRGDRRERAVDSRDGTVLYELDPGSDAQPWGIADTPDGSAAYGLYQIAGQLVLKRLSQNGVETLIEDPGPYAFAQPDYSCRAMTVDNDGTFYIIREGALRQYRYNPEGAVEVEYLTVYALHDNKTVRTAVTQWNQTHQDHHFRFVTAEDQIAGTSLTIDDAITQLNTQLVNGEGPDVLILDGLPADSLMDKGFLEPLSGLDTAGIYPNVLGRFTLDGSLYAVPAKMTPYLLGRAVEDTEAVGSLEAFADTVEAGSRKLNTGYYSSQETERGWSDYMRDKADALYFAGFSDHVFDLWYPAWMEAIWEGGSFRPETYQEFLTQTKRLVEHYSLISFDTFVERYGTGDLLKNTEYEIIGATDRDARLEGGPYAYCLTATHNIGLLNFVPGDLNNSPWGYEPIPIEITGIPGPDGTGIAVPTAIAALRAGGNTQAGTEFIQVMLSDAVQSSFGSNSTDGYPVRWSSTPALLEKTEESRRQEFDITNDFEQALAALRCDLIDEVLFEAAREAALDHYEGKLTLQEAAEQVEKETALYLAEQR